MVKCLVVKFGLMKIVVKENPNEDDLRDVVDLINNVFKNASRFEEYNADRILKKISGSRGNAIFE